MPLSSNIFQHLNSIWWTPIKNKQIILWAIFILSIIPLLIPLILNNNINNDVAILINNSTLYKMFNMLLIGLSLPLLIETVLDYHNENMMADFLDILERFVNVIYLGLIPAVIVILASTSSLTSNQFWFLLYLQRNFMCTTFIHNILNVESISHIVPQSQLLLAILLFFVSTSITYCYQQDNGGQSLVMSSLSLTFFCISVIYCIVTLLMWSYALYKTIKVDKWRKLSYKEFKASTLLIGLLIYFFGTTILVIVYNSWIQLSYKQYNEVYFCLFVIVLIAHALVVNIVPGRAARRIIEDEREMLIIKREFVKSISNQITSPLYVSHISLQVLISQLKDEIDIKKIIAQVYSIYYANETALSIMSDLLQYGNIDTGTFQLKDKRVSMKYVFKGRFAPLQYLAQKYQLKLLIFDEIGVSEYYKDPNILKTNPDSNIEELNSFNAISKSFDVNKYSLSIDIISMDQMFRNIMYTMVKNTTSGGTISIRFSIKQEEDINMKRGRNRGSLENKYLYIEYSVISVLEEDQQTVRDFNIIIFEPSKLNNEGDQGMDLWIANKIVDAHGGNIDFHCDVNRRNPRLLVTLPLILNDNSDEFVIDIVIDDENRNNDSADRSDCLLLVHEQEYYNSDSINSNIEEKNNDIESSSICFHDNVMVKTSSEIENSKKESDSLSCEYERIRLLDEEINNNSRVYTKSNFIFPIQTIPIKSIICNEINPEEFSCVTFFTSGSCSDIFQCFYRDELVIIKMLKRELVDNVNALNELNSEMEILTRCKHDNIIKIYGKGLSPRPFVVLEYLEGGTLSSKLNHLKSNNLTSRINYRDKSYITMIQYASTIAKVMRYLHSEFHSGVTIIHRDLKPENIGFSLDGTIKLFDFGLASTVFVKQNSSDLYQLTGCTGTINYMAPEVALRQPYSEKVDVYSFGILLWQMITLKQPYSYVNNEVIFGRIVLNGERPFIQPEFPKILKDLMVQCWSKESVERPDFNAIVEQLEDMLNFVY